MKEINQEINQRINNYLLYNYNYVIIFNIKIIKSSKKYSK